MGLMKPIIPPPIIGIAFAFVMWLLAKASSGLVVTFPYQLWLAALTAGAGLTIDLISIAAFFKRKTTVNPLTPSKTNTLVVEGLYRISRNPMYLGMLLILIGWGIWLGQPLNIVPILLFIWVINEAQIKPEERALREIFGEEYDSYCAKVRRWI